MREPKAIEIMREKIIYRTISERYRRGGSQEHRQRDSILLNVNSCCRDSKQFK